MSSTPRVHTKSPTGGLGGDGLLGGLGGGRGGFGGDGGDGGGSGAGLGGGGELGGSGGNGGTGGSAGGIGAITNGDWLAARLPPSTKFRVMPQGGFFGQAELDFAGFMRNQTASTGKK